MDWAQLLKELQGWGVTQKQIAEHCNVAQPTVSDLANGKYSNPSFSFGTALITMHRVAKRDADRKAAGQPQAAAIAGQA